jgi:hypothetical protein
VRDLTRPCRMGFELPMDRVPSDGETRIAFAIGVWCREMGYSAPIRLYVHTHTLLGEYWHVQVEEIGERVLQCWPHPQNPIQTLIVEALVPMPAVNAASLHG